MNRQRRVVVRLAAFFFIRDGSYIPADVPSGLRSPVAVTVAAYQNGRYGSAPVRPSSAVYRTFRLLP